LKSTAALLAAAMFVWDRTTASPSLAGAAAVITTCQREQQQQQQHFCENFHTVGNYLPFPQPKSHTCLLTFQPLIGGLHQDYYVQD